ncbi:OmpH family outer membrane protein [Nannocystis sp.]|uniref:OmpH family outer membrane protein n=1 Tax=Nannocystis sp. TaxID=1962667 RepID=UPI00242964DB|nr:OmpH family outer membrane protein [Nannocystis sp.]MBK7823980.1 OmpH family outer membrane protein [Nannocystis sp.]MBK9754992.1 OmpH family outer membrane protein [Nannocystis sp.]
MKRKSRLISLAALLLTSAAFLHPAAVAAAPPVKPLEKIAVVDLQRCILETVQGTKAKKDLEAAFAKGQSQLEKKTKDLQKKAEDLRAKAAMLAQEEIVKRQQELMLKDQELQQLYTDLQEGIATKEAQLTEKIYKNVAAIVKEIAADEALQLVLVRSQANVLYANPKFDLTNRIIVAYDKKHP